MAIFVARSDDGGLSWLPAVPVASHRYDSATRVPFDIYPDMAVDTVRVLPNGRANPSFGNVYVTWARYYPAGQFPGEANATGGSDVMIAVSRDSGLSWQLRTRPQPDTGVAESVLETNFNSGLDLLPGRGYLTWPRVCCRGTGGCVGGGLRGSMVPGELF